MSLHTRYLKCLSMGPKILNFPEKLVIIDNLFMRCLRLFYSSRKVTISSQEREVTIKEKTFWFKKETYLLPFDEIDHLDYDGTEIATSFGGTLTFLETHDGVERYTLSLVAKDEGFYPLCSFIGEGSSETGAFGVLTGDSLIDLSGTQQEDSRNLVKLICQRIGIQIGKSYDLSAINTITCPNCQQQVSAGNSKCLYCGSSTIK